MRVPDWGLGVDFQSTVENLDAFLHADQPKVAGRRRLLADCSNVESDTVVLDADSQAVLGWLEVDQHLPRVCVAQDVR
jgi:hypothetical protein